METSEEKFFEQLAKGRKGNEEEYEVELVKASTPAYVKSPVKKAEEEPDDGGPEGQLTIDVYQTPQEIVIESAVAGVKPDDIDINVTNDSITIRGERRREHRVEDEDYFYQECYWGKFSRSVILPQEVDPDSATVSFKNGILTVHLPKLNRKKTKKLKIKLE